LAVENGNTEMAVRHILEYLVKKEPKAKDNPAHRPEPPVQQKRNVAKF